MLSPHEIILQPVVSEHTTKLSTLHNTYAFKVAKEANKIAIKGAVEAIFNVHVTKVSTLSVKGKKRRVRYRMGLTSSWKKAYVSIQEGERIEIFEGV